MEELLLPNISRWRKPIQLVKYMGSKRSILDFIIPIIDSITPVDVPVVDLFAGTHSVGYALAGKHPIYANDIQRYSRAIGRAILSTTAELPEPDALWTKVEETFQTNKSDLEKSFQPWLEEETSYLSPSNFNRDALEVYRKFQEEFPFAGQLDRGGDKKLKALISQYVERGKSDPLSKPWALITTYYNNAYFSLQQSIDIDSLRRAIEESLEADSHLYYVALACLLHACGYCTPSPGHFAQYRQLNSVAVFEDIARYRNREVKKYFLNKYAEMQTHLLPAKHSSHVAAESHLEYLDRLKPKKTDGTWTVYADPPYSFVHYSRFYHVLETVVRYDYPACDFFGRYRDDRYQSKFCQHANALDEFKSLIAAVRKKKMNLILSYADTALIPLNDLIAVSRKAFNEKNVDVERSNHLHATMGRNGDKTRAVEETVIVCRFK